MSCIGGPSTLPGVNMIFSQPCVSLRNCSAYPFLVFFKSLFWSFPQAHIHSWAQSSLEEIPLQISRAHSVSLSASLVFCPENSSHLGLPQFQNLSSELSKTTRLYLDASPGTAACKLQAGIIVGVHTCFPYFSNYILLLHTVLPVV